MTECPHQNLLLLSAPRPRVQCRHCRLIISADELGDGFCPECYETDGWKRNDFDAVASSGTEKTRYRCEDCNAVIELA